MTIGLLDTAVEVDVDIIVDDGGANTVIYLIASFISGGLTPHRLHNKLEGSHREVLRDT